MAITVKEKTAQQVTPGTHLAVCYRIVDLGTQPDSGYGEKEKIVIFWELPHERVTIEGKEMPMGISKFYTRSLGKKASLRKDLESWRGKSFTKEELDGFDLAAIIGKGCQLQVVDDEGRSKVSAVVGLPKGTTMPPPWNPCVEYSVTEGRNETYKHLPDWVREMADKCLEWNESERTSAPVKPALGQPVPPIDVETTVEDDVLF